MKKIVVFILLLVGMECYARGKVLNYTFEQPKNTTFTPVYSKDNLQSMNAFGESSSNQSGNASIQSYQNGYQAGFNSVLFNNQPVSQSVSQSGSGQQSQSTSQSLPSVPQLSPPPPVTSQTLPSSPPSTSSQGLYKNTTSTSQTTKKTPPASTQNANQPPTTLAGVAVPGRPGFKPTPTLSLSPKSASPSTSSQGLYKNTTSTSQTTKKTPPASTQNANQPPTTLAGVAVPGTSGFKPTPTIKLLPGEVQNYINAMDPQQKQKHKINQQYNGYDYNDYDEDNNDGYETDDETFGNYLDPDDQYEWSSYSAN